MRLHRIAEHVGGSAGAIGPDLSAVIVFLASAAFVVYVLLGYPLLLAALARLRSRPISRRFTPRTVTVLLPAHNGARWLGAKLESLLALDYPHELVEILVVDDGSTDSTPAIAREYQGRGVRLLSQSKSGKAVALNAALAEAHGEILLFTDVRQPLDRGAMRSLVGCFGDQRVGVVSGELVIRKGTTEEEANIGLYWRYEKWMRKNLSAIDSVMGATGAIYAMRRVLARPLPPDTLLDDVHLPMYAFFAGYRVVFDEGARAFDEPNTLETEFRRKVRTLAGNYQLIARFPALLGPRNRMWLHFMSHKLARLLLPFALIAIAAASFWLPDPWRIGVLAAQAGGYGLALLDPAVPRWLPLKRLTSPARTFVVLMAATLCATAILFVPPGRLWRGGGGRA